MRLATELIVVRGDGKTHSVAAVVRAADDTVATGLNLFHFTGGPCAELTALANLAAQTSSPARLIVAVGDRGRGVLPPCGRCRQVLLDTQPEVHVILEIGRDPLPIAECLPFSYGWNDHQ